MNQKKKIDENIIINDFLKKLNFSKKETFNFENDAAILKVPINKEIIVSHDALTENIHFFSSDSPESIALKSIRTNLSDLVSMGATPYCYTMSLCLNNNINKYWLKKFTNALYKEQKKYNFYLLGGDIISSNYISISISAFGLINNGVYISRSGAKLNDDIWVTGNIGDSFVGYQILKNKLFIKNKKIKEYFLNSYYYPKPPIILSHKLSKLMNSAIDISDGFLGDLEKITSNSLKGATIFSKLIPFSKKLKFLLKNEKLPINKVLSWGDDYQVIFTSNSKNRLKISKLSRDSKYKITLIGKINNTKELDFQGFNLKKAKKNYLHVI